MYLDKNKEYLFCFKKRKIIEHKDCDYYEHNRRCEKNKDYLHRTHSTGSVSGWNYVNEPTPLLNECEYCLKEKENLEKYRLSDEAGKIMEEETELFWIRNQQNTKRL